jgi:hypothetical protein
MSTTLIALPIVDSERRLVHIYSKAMIWPYVLIFQPLFDFYDDKPCFHWRRIESSPWNFEPMQMVSINNLVKLHFTLTVTTNESYVFFGFVFNFDSALNTCWFSLD